MMYDAAAHGLFGAYARTNFPTRATPPAIEHRLTSILAKYTRRLAG